MKNTYQTGLLYELRAAGYIRSLGYRVLKRRFRARDGEIDLIALDGDVLVFIEVKARPQMPPGTGIDAVDADKKRRLRHASNEYLSRNRTPGQNYRYDILEFSRAGIQYLKNAF